MTYTSARASMSPAERAKQDRRIARYIKQGLHLHELKRLGIGEAKAKQIAEEYGLTIARGQGGLQ